MADRLDDLICTFHPGASAMETLAILLLGWIIFGTVLTIVGRFLYSKLADIPKESGSPPPVLAPTAPVLAAPVNVDKPVVSNTERFITTLKNNPPPPVPKAGRTRSNSQSRSINRQSSTDAALANAAVPAVTGSNSDCVKWITGCLSWFYTRPDILAEVSSLWKNSLNVHTKSSEIETGVCVEFQDIIFQSDDPPSISNVFSELSTNEQATVTGDFESQFEIAVQACRQTREGPSVTEYGIQVERLRARCNISVSLEGGRVCIKFDGWPEVRLRIVRNDNMTNLSENDESLLLDIITDMVASALRSSSVSVNWGHHSDLPKFVPSINPAEPILPVHYDSMLTSTTRLITAGNDKKLLVKVIKATGLASSGGCHEVFGIIEMDDPPQRHQTSVKRDTDNPFWDENFLFDLSARTEEIMFELYDRSSRGRELFLGLGIVGMEELLMNPSQRQIIPLQSRPYENDSVSGSLTLEFLFVDPKELDQRLDSAGGWPNPMMEPAEPSRASPRRSPMAHSPQNLLVHNAQKKSASLPCKLKIKLVGGANGQKVWMLCEDAAPLVRRRWSLDMLCEDLESVDDYKDQLEQEADRNGGVMGSVSSSLGSKEEEDRAQRSRNRKRSFFKSIKERLSRSKTRSKSVDPGTIRDDSLSRDPSSVRSVSADRGRLGLGLLAVPGSGQGDDSARSSLSEVSGISNASTRTYLDEASSLVLETLENGIKKHYLIPLALAEKRKWKNKGTKLHIFSDHVFVAKHLPGGTVCQVCNLALTRRPGKQGYECRDCLLRCHKPCHVKVESLCPSSTVHFMELEFVEDTSSDRKPRFRN